MDKKPLPSLGTIPGTLGRGRGERLTSLSNTRRDLNVTVGRGVPKPEFTPNLAAATQRIKREDTANIDSELQQRGFASALLDPTKHTYKPVAARFKPIIKSKPAGQGLDVPVAADFEPAPAAGFKKREQQSDVAFPNKISTKELYMDPSNPNHPSVLPFVDPRLKAMADDDTEKEALIAKLKREAIEMEIEGLAAPEIEVSSEQVPTPLMYKGDFLNEDNLFFIQLPSALPFQPSKNPNAKTNPPNNNNNNNTNGNTTNTTTSTTTTTTTTTSTTSTTNPNAPPTAPQRPGGGPPSNEFLNTLHGVNGHIGKIVVYKSGKVKFKIGDYLYDITAANNPNFLEELMVVGDTSCYRVGPMDQHLIVTPDIEDLLQRIDQTL